ncbi:DEKNAAC103786 [Brettanomyces naardenensis]|uniref:DEKNAAC103786 n=1 Tax=Brettanomyces naardenensis TaxID=13370 RepID=A0A448YPE0_BRENA|nr:DEKNAAC103786 [Brettanomyces naardenensis]
MSKISNFYKPVFNKTIYVSAPTQSVQWEYVKREDGIVIVSREGVSGYEERKRPRRLDRVLDSIVRFSGSEYVFYLILIGLLCWAFTGIKYFSLKWQALISDVQAIVSYIFDSFLMRQQINGYYDVVTATNLLRSRCLNHYRMINDLLTEQEKQAVAELTKEQEVDLSAEFPLELPKENWYGRAATAFSSAFGHPLFIAIYWISILVWLAFGSMNHWSNEWELYINTATSALMVLVFSFIANIRERHSVYMKKCFDAIIRADGALEVKLRVLTGSTLENPEVCIPPMKVNTVQKVVFVYSDIIGTLVGIAILLVFMVIWVCLGPTMHWNSNWWLISGTYAGMIGLNDGFVLRNVQFKFGQFEQSSYDLLDKDDTRVFQSIHLPKSKEIDEELLSWMQRISVSMNVICGNEFMTLVGLIFVVGLIIGASAMKWSTTGQLLCNIPPSIVESFFMIILLTGHNYTDGLKRKHLRCIYEGRLSWNAYVNRAAEFKYGLDGDYQMDGLM